jgi:uncharacterized 2Fe-2S/4Fe-4S cluster protein (DUF4445 family)
MPATLTINGHRVAASPGESLFDAAARAGVRVPTSCVTQGKCKECVVEVTSGGDRLSPPTVFEKHLDVRGGPFRLSCQARIVEDEGDVECQTMRRGQMRIERSALHLPTTHQTTALDPGVVRDGNGIVDTVSGETIDRSTGPIHGLAIDLGTTTIVVRLVDLETGSLVGETSFENPQRLADRT